MYVQVYSYMVHMRSCNYSACIMCVQAGVHISIHVFINHRYDIG
jgi:hypothetical protein